MNTEIENKMKIMPTAITVIKEYCQRYAYSHIQHREMTNADQTKTKSSSVKSINKV